MQHRWSGGANYAARSAERDADTNTNPRTSRVATGANRRTGGFHLDSRCRGGITVRVVPRGERAIQFHRLDRTRWGFYGNQENLVGKAYQIELENTTSSRAKIVVGVDGMNIYRKKDLAGNPTDDIGSILSPGAKRTLPGWQTSSERAERFVFSPSDWSDARGIHDAQIGTILVEIYFEEESPAADTMKRKSATTLGTASGEEVDSQVGTVSFVPSSSQPSATALVIYGGTRTSEW